MIDEIDHDKPELPPSDFDFLADSLRLRADEQRALDDSVTELRFRFGQVQEQSKAGE